MTTKKGKKQKNLQAADDRDDESGGKSSGVEFRGYVGTSGPLRDDLLTGQELRQHLQNHANENHQHVRKSKETLIERKALKEGKITLDNYRSGLAARGMASKYQSHPMLSSKAQFSGEPKVSFDPSVNNAKTNEDRKELVLKNDLRHDYKPKQAPTFNPRPQR